MGAVLSSNGVGYNVNSWSVQEDYMTMDPTDSSGSTGQFTMSADRSLDPMTFRDDAVNLQGDGTFNILGDVREQSISPTNQIITADMALAWFNTEMTFPPVSGRLDDCMQSVFTRVFDTIPLSETTFPSLVMSSAPELVVFPGARMTAWQYIKNVCQVYKYYLRIEDNTTFRASPIAATTASTVDDKNGFLDLNFSINDNKVGRAVEVAYYNLAVTPSNQTEVYPIRGDFADATIIQVQAGEIVEVELQLESWLSSVNQPVAVDLVGPSDQSGTNGKYCIAGSDGLPVSAAQWTAAGGNLRVELTEDPSVVKVVVTGPRNSTLYDTDGVTARLSPFSVAATSGNLYNSLHITGNGVTMERKTITCPTGCTKARANTEDVAISVDNTAVSTLGQAWDVALRAAQAYAGPTYTASWEISQTSPSNLEPNRNPLVTADGVFLTESVTVGPGTQSKNGRLHTAIGSFNLRWSGGKISDFNTQWTGKKFGQYSIAPLRRTP